MRVIQDTPNRLVVEIGNGFNTSDIRKIIVDKNENDIRITDGSHVVKIQMAGRKLEAIYVDDLCQWVKP